MPLKLILFCLKRAIKEGELAPEEWRGELDVDYFLGPELKYPKWKIRMEILTSNKMATIYNTIGILEGQEEPGNQTAIDYVF